MSNTSVRAAAEGMPAPYMNRRETLRSICLGATAAMVPTSAALAFPAQSELDRLIETHRVIDTEWIAVYEVHLTVEKDDPAAPAYAARERACSEREGKALADLCAYRPNDLSEVQKRFAYLMGPGGPWDGIVPKEDELFSLIASMTPEAAL